MQRKSTGMQHLFSGHHLLCSVSLLLWREKTGSLTAGSALTDYTLTCLPPPSPSYSLPMGQGWVLCKNERQERALLVLWCSIGSPPQNRECTCQWDGPGSLRELCKGEMRREMLGRLLKTYDWRTQLEIIEHGGNTCIKSCDTYISCFDLDWFIFANSATGVTVCLYLSGTWYHLSASFIWFRGALPVSFTTWLIVSWFSLVRAMKRFTERCTWTVTFYLKNLSLYSFFLWFGQWRLSLLEMLVFTSGNYQSSVL